MAAVICFAIIAVLIIFEEFDALLPPVSPASTATNALQDLIRQYFGAMPSVVSVPVRLGFVLVIFLMALIVHRLAWVIAGGILNSHAGGRAFFWKSYHHRQRDSFPKPDRNEERRRRTIQHLIASTISVTAFTVFAFVGLSQFLSPSALAVITGLLSAGFGFGARILIGDLLAGMSNLFEDNFDVDEKVEIPHVTGKVEGVIERVNLRTMSVRAPTGELYIIPNGEVRILRNFSRGRFSKADIQLNIRTPDLGKVLPLLEDLGQEASVIVPDLLEPWLVISEEGKLGEHTQLTLVIKTRFGHAAQARTRLLALVQERLAQADIVLAD